MLLIKVDSVKKAEAFIDAPEAADYAEHAGVIGDPEISALPTRKLALPRLSPFAGRIDFFRASRQEFAVVSVDGVFEMACGADLAR